MPPEFIHKPVPYDILFGNGKHRDLPDLLDESSTRLLLMYGDSISQTVLPNKVKSSLENYTVNTWSGVRSHVPLSAVQEGRQIVEEHDIDAIVSIGGGSAVDTGKAIAISANTRQSVEALLKGPEVSNRSQIPHYSLPTTLSAAEMTDLAGISRPELDMKRGIKGPGVFLDGIVYDPSFLLETPERLIASTGLNALDHGIEMVYCDRHQPFTDATALHAIRLLSNNLRDATAGDLESLAYCQAGASISLIGYPNAATGINHSLAHILGVRYDVPHGVGNAAVLPHGMRFNIAAAADRLALIADALDVVTHDISAKEAAEKAVVRCEELIEDLGLPSQLREFDIPKDDLPIVADRLLEEDFVDSNPRKLPEENVLTLLENAY